ncbi:MAG TPA: ligase-associated DNA damage response endonuclease PdeM [Sphingomicrobium sp.]|nr:ligase-associated DNA damage response endonuclease PdeM [Sphingomicrobium sp.]
MVPFSFAGETFEATSSGALYWRALQSLLIADLHLEKASWYAAGGQFLPPYDSHATLTAVARDAERTGAERIFCLGDSFHDRFGCDRLPNDARELLTGLTAAHSWTWIVGNHDPAFADRCGGEIVGEVEIGGVVLRHEAAAGELRAEISGHFHPKLRVNLNGRHISRRCFVVSATKIIMPAFGALTGGLDARHPEILRSVGSDAAALVPVSDRLLRFPLAA